MPNNNAFSDILKEEVDSLSKAVWAAEKTARTRPEKLQLKLRQSLRRALLQMQSHDITEAQQLPSAAAQGVRINGDKATAHQLKSAQEENQWDPGLEILT